jgi:hypothetical protein
MRLSLNVSKKAKMLFGLLKLAAFAVVAVLFAACPLPNGPDWTRTIDTQDIPSSGVVLFYPGNGNRFIKSGGTISGNTADMDGDQVATGTLYRTTPLGPGDFLWVNGGSQYGFDE